MVGDGGVGVGCCCGGVYGEDGYGVVYGVWVIRIVVFFVCCVGVYLCFFGVYYGWGVVWCVMVWVVYGVCWEVEWVNGYGGVFFVVCYGDVYLFCYFWLN